MASNRVFTGKSVNNLQWIGSRSFGPPFSLTTITVTTWGWYNFFFPGEGRILTRRNEIWIFVHDGLPLRSTTWSLYCPLTLALLITSTIFPWSVLRSVQLRTRKWVPKCLDWQNNSKISASRSPLWTQLSGLSPSSTDESSKQSSHRTLLCGVEAVLTGPSCLYLFCE